MRLSEYLTFINRPVRYVVGNLRLDATIVDVRQVYGRMDYLLRPTSGEGEQWVSAENVEILEDVK